MCGLQLSCTKQVLARHAPLLARVQRLTIMLSNAKVSIVQPRQRQTGESWAAVRCALVVCGLMPTGFVALILVLSFDRHSWERLPEYHAHPVSFAGGIKTTKRLL